MIPCVFVIVAIQSPLSIIWRLLVLYTPMPEEINPLQINRVLKIKYSQIDQYSDWDRRVVRPENYWNWCNELFEAKDKKDTEFYRVFRDRCPCVDTYVTNFVLLYESIRDRGYLDQFVGLPSVHAHNYKRVSVALDRYGEYVLVHGRHRLAIAKYLRLTSIPVDHMISHPNCNQSSIL